ncbi:protein FANTASTIC FOUR 3-like [Durio zibethinus]|uniref:Protein FANTASTIC FOUR 3-like n=1 Tax=Durio zibethinus TaxID=66656 RepID=A0A6P5X329_DURZI|nr:protein FANTASTIC FOUR 3-like [Durio zibethinus]
MSWPFLCLLLEGGEKGMARLVNLEEKRIKEAITVTVSINIWEDRKCPGLFFACFWKEEKEEKREWQGCGVKSIQPLCTLYLLALLGDYKFTPHCSLISHAKRPLPSSLPPLLSKTSNSVFLCLLTLIVACFSNLLLFISANGLPFLYHSCRALYEEVMKQTDFVHDKIISSNPDMGGWSFLQALSNGPQSTKKIVEKENTYVHPLLNRSLSTLSKRSLELCTENLGNETGSDILEDNIFSLSSSDSEGGNSPTRKQSKSRQLLGAEKAISRNFPPPLTTISGSESLQIRPHREDGRLVIKAVKTPSTNTLFQAERSNGRLRLCLLKDSTESFDYEEEAADKESESSSEDNKKEEFENDSNYEAEEKEEEERGTYLEEEIDGKRADVGMKKFQRHGRGRCIEGEHESKGLLNWELFWVATP